MPVAKVPNHAHCVECGKAIPAKDDTCSDECAEQLEEQETKRKRMTYITFGLMALAFLLVFLGPQIAQML